MSFLLELTLSKTVCYIEELGLGHAEVPSLGFFRTIKNSDLVKLDLYGSSTRTKWCT